MTIYYVFYSNFGNQLTPPHVPFQQEIIISLAVMVMVVITMILDSSVIGGGREGKLNLLC
jgi:hypothetical protein